MGSSRLLTRKSSLSSTPLPRMGVKLLQRLKPKTQGRLSTASSTHQMTEDFFRLQPKVSMEMARMFSKTARTVEKLAKTMKRKKRAPQKRPPAMFTKTGGRVSKMREGPLSGCTPKVKQAGKMMVPAIRATKVSSAQMRAASPGRLCSSLM